MLVFISVAGNWRRVRLVLNKMRYYSLNCLRPVIFVLLWQVLPPRGLTIGDTIRNLGLVSGGLEGGGWRENSGECIGNVRGKNHDENAIPSSQLIDISGSVIVSINIDHGGMGIISGTRKGY